MPRHSAAKAKRSTSKGSAMSRVRAAHDKHDRIAKEKKHEATWNRSYVGHQAKHARKAARGTGRGEGTDAWRRKDAEMQEKYDTAHDAYRKAGGRKGRKTAPKRERRAAGASAGPAPTTWLGAGWGF